MRDGVSRCSAAISLRSALHRTIRDLIGSPCHIQRWYSFPPDVTAHQEVALRTLPAGHHYGSRIILGVATPHFGSIRRRFQSAVALYITHQVAWYQRRTSKHLYPALSWAAILFESFSINIIPSSFPTEQNTFVAARGYHSADHAIGSDKLDKSSQEIRTYLALYHEIA